MLSGIARGIRASLIIPRSPSAGIGRRYPNCAATYPDYRWAMSRSARPFRVYLQ